MGALFQDTGRLTVGRNITLTLTFARGPSDSVSSDSSFVTVEETTLVVQSEMERVVSSHWLWAVIINCNCNRSATKSNHLINNPLVFVTQTPNTWHYEEYYLLAVCFLMISRLYYCSKQKMEVVRSSETSMDFFGLQNVTCHKLEDLRTE
jgi:hypothetical protein